jgi:hypothetical protein
MKYALTVTYSILRQDEMQFFQTITVAALIIVNRLLHMSVHSPTAAVLYTLITTCDVFLHV